MRLLCGQMQRARCCWLTRGVRGVLRRSDALQRGIADWVTGGAGQSGRQLRHSSRRLLEHLRVHSRTSSAGGNAPAPKVRLVRLRRRVCAFTFGMQELEDESLKQLLRDVRLPQDSAPRAVAAPSYSSREVRFAAARLARAGVAPER